MLGLSAGKFRDCLILSCAKCQVRNFGGCVGAVALFGELLLYLFMVWGTLQAFYLLTVLLLPKTLTVQQLEHSAPSSM